MATSGPYTMNHDLFKEGEYANESPVGVTL